MATRRRRIRRLAQPLEMFSGTPGVSPQVQAAFDEAVRKYLQRPAVTGIDVGYKVVDGERTKRMAVRIHVREKFALRALGALDRFPKTINGVPVDVIEAVYESHQHAALVQGQAATLQPGLSIGRAGDTTGTLGLFVTDDRAAGRLGLLSAAHVLFATAGLPGDSIVQPGVADGGTAAQVVARSARTFLASDAALAHDTGARPHDVRVAISGVTLTAPREPRLGEVLEKCGRSTQVTRGIIDGIGHFMGVRDSFRLVGLTDDPIVDSGDSGSVWYDPVSGAAIGLHCKGPNVPTPSQNFAIASRLTVVTKRLGVTVAQGPASQ